VILSSVILNLHLYSRDVRLVVRVIKSQDKNPRSQQSIKVLYCVLSMITTCFGLHKKPSSGDYHVIQNIKKKVTVRYGLLWTRVFVLWFKFASLNGRSSSLSVWDSFCTILAHKVKWDDVCVITVLTGGWCHPNQSHHHAPSSANSLHCVHTNCRDHMWRTIMYISSFWLSLWL
jgi:hypothetical protein